MIKIALNGGKPKTENPNLPTSFEEYKKEIDWFQAHGLHDFHIHFRDPEGQDTLLQKYVQPHPQEALQKLKKQQYPTAIAVGYFAVILVVYSSSSLTALSNRSVTSFAGFLSSSVTTTAQIRPAIKPGNNS